MGQLSHRFFKYQVIITKFHNLKIIWTPGLNLAFPDILSRNVTLSDINKLQLHMTVRVASKRGLQAISTGTRGSITGFLRSSLSAAKSSVSGRWRNSSHISPTIVFGSIIIALKTNGFNFHFQHPPTSKMSQLPNPKIFERTNRTKFTTFLFRSTAVGLLCSYIVSRNQKRKNRK